MSAKQVLMLVNTQAYDDPRVMNEAQSLSQSGYQVRVIGAARLPGSPTRKTISGVEFVLTPMVSTKHPLRLLAAFWQLLRADVGEVTLQPPSRQTTLISMIFFLLWSLRLGWRLRADVVHSHDLSPLPAAWLLARLKRARLIYDAHESAPDFYGGAKGRWMGRLERAFIGKVDAVITVGQRLAKALEVRGARRVLIIGNWKRLADFEVDAERLNAERARLNQSQYALTIAYMGTLDSSREIEPLLQATLTTPHVLLVIGGAGAVEERVRQAAARASNIQWLGWVNSRDIPLYTQLADVVYYCLNVEETHDQSIAGNNYYSTPNKLFEAFAAGKALIARRGVGEIGEILEAHHAAVLLDQVTPEALQVAFDQLCETSYLKELQQASLQARELYHWGAAEQRLLNLYDELTRS
ncbi:MAG: glycosyltransferase [Anaerolineae bacterium]|nr:glycosyltransferase [Anaerolineae bacterium]